MRTAAFYAYNPWRDFNYGVAVQYRGKVLKQCESNDYNTALEMAKAWAIINGFTHYRHTRDTIQRIYKL